MGDLERMTWAEWRAQWKPPVTLAALASAWVVVRTWDSRNDTWACYILCRLAFGLLVGVFMSPPLRTGINSLSKYVAQQFEGRSASPGEADEVRAACREVKVTKYSWEDDGTYIKISVPVDKGDIADITDKDIETVITPLSAELRITVRDLVHVLQLAPLNNAIDPKDSNAFVNRRSCKVVLKLNKWHDRREWRSLIDNGRSI